MGERAAMACTVAVEEAIDEHYADQIRRLGDDEAPLRAELEEFRREELEHRDIGLQNEAEQAPAYELLSATIKAGSRPAIWLSTRICTGPPARSEARRVGQECVRPRTSRGAPDP